MLGHKLVSTLAKARRFDLHASLRTPLPPQFATEGVSYHTSNLLNGQRAIGSLLGEIKPDFVVNAVGAVKQKNLTAQMDDTFYLNGVLPHVLTLLNPNPHGRVIHLSTDCVYRGDIGNYSESILPDADDLYGRSKACGEISYGKHLTIRTSMIGFEIGGHLGLLSWFFGLPRGSTVRGFINAIFSGLPTPALSRTVLDLLDRESALTGIVHVASEPISKFDLLTRINDRFSLGHVLVADETVKIDRSLDDTLFRRATGSKRPDWDALTEELARDFEAGEYTTVYFPDRR